MTKPRKKYRPRPVNPVAYLTGIMGAALLTRDDVIRFSEEVHAAVDAARQGKADKPHWQSIFTAINLMDELIRMRLAKDVDGAIGQMQHTVAVILNRSAERGTKALLPDELATLRDIAATFTDLLAGLTHAQLFAAQERVDRKILQALRTGTGATFVKEPV